ncbi:MAG: ArsR family transcriptional regulator [Candidatus Bathyarchaeia archaeon]
MDPFKTSDDIEKALASLGKLRIIRLLMREPNHAFTRYEIGKKTPLNSNDIKNNLKTLVEIGWVKEVTTQHLKKYSINLDNEVVSLLYNFFKQVRYV